MKKLIPILVFLAMVVSACGSESIISGGSSNHRRGILSDHASLWTCFQSKRWWI